MNDNPISKHFIRRQIENGWGRVKRPEKAQVRLGLYRPDLEPRLKKWAEAYPDNLLLVTRIGSCCYKLFTLFLSGSQRPIPDTTDPNRSMYWLRLDRFGSVNSTDTYRSYRYLPVIQLMVVSASFSKYR